jgi:hypothetical protein
MGLDAGIQDLRAETDNLDRWLGDAGTPLAKADRHPVLFHPSHRKRTRLERISGPFKSWLSIVTGERIPELGPVF